MYPSRITSISLPSILITLLGKAFLDDNPPSRIKLAFKIEAAFAVEESGFPLIFALVSARKFP